MPRQEMRAKRLLAELTDHPADARYLGVKKGKARVQVHVDTELNTDVMDILSQYGDAKITGCGPESVELEVYVKEA